MTQLQKFKETLARDTKSGDGDNALIAQYLLDFLEGAPKGEEVEIMQGTLQNIIDISQSMLTELNTHS